MGLNYNLNIPYMNNNPSNDQPLMEQNFNSINTIIAQDHQTFSSPNYGLHNQCTFPNQNVPGSLPTDPEAIAYPGPGVVNSSHTQYFWANSQAKFPLSAIRAFANFTTLAAAAGPARDVTTNLSWNVTGPITQLNNGLGTGQQFAITLTTNAVNTGAILVFVCSDKSTSLTTSTFPAYSYAAPVLTVNTTTGPAGTLVNVLVLQI
jgi:hypothetical protein